MGARTAVIAAILMAGGIYFYINWRKNKMMLMPMTTMDMMPATTYTPLIDMNPLPGGFPYNVGAMPHMDPITAEAVPADDPYPRQMPDTVINFVANQMVQELEARDNANLIGDESDTLYQLLLTNYYDELLEIAIANDYRLTPFTGNAMSLYSNLLLKVSMNHAIAISPSSRGVHMAQTFTNPPMSPGYGISGSLVALS